jgi:hypothetical protein
LEPAAAEPWRLDWTDAMGLLDYDSDTSHDGPVNVDAFQISNLTSAKKPRIDVPPSSTAEPLSAAPDVLSEVRNAVLPCACIFNPY